jgi:leucyl/phenylalanyl-tRNA---protein transferase
VIAMTVVSTYSRATWASLDLHNAPADGGLVAFCDDLTATALLDAYRCGLYPFPAATIEHQLVNELTYEAEVATGRVRVLGDPVTAYAVAWCSPDPRPLILTNGARVQRSMRPRLRSVSWTTTVNACFERVVEQCRADRSDSWLTDELMASLCHLHQEGHAHSVEVWDGNELVGGTYGIRLGNVFSADSQFTRRSGAGKVAVADLTRRFADAGGVAVDVQRDGDHVRLLGARPVPRRAYLELLHAPAAAGELATDEMPARRLL